MITTTEAEVCRGARGEARSKREAPAPEAGPSPCLPGLASAGRSLGEIWGAGPGARLDQARARLAEDGQDGWCWLARGFDGVTTMPAVARAAKRHPRGSQCGGALLQLA